MKNFELEIKVYIEMWSMWSENEGGPDVDPDS